MKQEYEMTQQEMDDIIQINKDRMPVMKIGGITTGMDLQEKINRYWLGLSNKYGFHQMSVEGSSKGHLFFLAEPKPIIKEKTPEEIDEEKQKTISNFVSKEALSFFDFCKYYGVTLTDDQRDFYIEHFKNN